MPRQSITFTSPNDEWLSKQVESEEYLSKSEVVNDLIRKARVEEERVKYIRARLQDAEDSGIAEESPEQIRQELLKRNNLNE
ncbi:ribbon-helix-helix domain-containing protein [Sanyastnella coralliicola]|uniref:ribbon-helix-helix domain-containing protein n=1 Tax=Sanyastnella coralliicola TaxID=3069118 RepID=UPI0027BADC27|nr:hypothetical protein [Longitalea sp. SCSIO 12813]